MRSQSQPMNSRARIVIATEAMIVLPICSFVRRQFFAHDRHQRRDAEPGEEAQEEREPRHVERPHLRCLQREEIDARRFVANFHVFYRSCLLRSTVPAHDLGFRHR